tara:strand:+ start:78 stop:638 length:561 start_codon:yes stop_codon:yes gene_type:complete
MKKKTIRKKIHNEIEIPEGINIEIEGKKIKVSKDNEELSKRLQYDVKKEDNKIIINCEKPSKKDKKLINTTIAHIKNMISGLQEKYVYKLQIASIHFPITVKVEKNELVIKNFIGERKDRKAKILDNVDVKVEGEIITLESSDKEKAGQTAANIEQTTKIKNKDRRIFQDGIYITEKMKGSKGRKK